MDFSKFKTPDWLIVGGGLLFLIGGFLDWISVDIPGFGSVSGGNVFDFFFTGIVPWILIIGSAVITVLLVLGSMRAGSAPWPLIILAATVLGAFLVLLRFIAPGLGEDTEGVDLGRGIGLILCTVAGIAAAVGGVMNFTAKGGNLSDLTDRNKLRSSFQGTGTRGTTDQPPPPPPPAAPPPPPPAT